MNKHNCPHSQYVQDPDTKEWFCGGCGEEFVPPILPKKIVLTGVRGAKTLSMVLEKRDHIGETMVWPQDGLVTYFTV